MEEVDSIILHFLRRLDVFVSYINFYIIVTTILLKPELLNSMYMF